MEVVDVAAAANVVIFGRAVAAATIDVRVVVIVAAAAAAAAASVAACKSGHRTFGRDSG